MNPKIAAALHYFSSLMAVLATVAQSGSIPPLTPWSSLLVYLAGGISAAGLGSSVISKPAPKAPFGA